MTEIEILVEKAVDGDSEAYRKLYNLSRRQVYFTCLGLVKNTADAEDIMQETFFTVMIKLADLKEKDSFQAWVNRIAINKCKNFLNKRIDYSLEEKFEDSENEPEDEEITLPDEYIENEEKRKIIIGIIMESLSDVQRQVIIMYYYNEMTVAEISQELECPIGTVTYRLSSARKQIKKEVLKYEKVNNEHIHAVLPVPFLTSLLKAESGKVRMPEIDFSSITQAATGILATAGKTAQIITSKAIAAMTAVVIGGGGAGYYISTKLDEQLYDEKNKVHVLSDDEAVLTDFSETENIIGYNTGINTLMTNKTLSSVLSSDMVSGSMLSSATVKSSSSGVSVKKTSATSLIKTSATSTALRNVLSVLASAVSKTTVTSVTQTTDETTNKTTTSATVSTSTTSTTAVTTVTTVSAEPKLDIALADTHAAYIGIDGTLYAWGSNEYGQLGDGTTENQSEPVAIMEGTKFISVSTGKMNTAAIDEDGNLYVWGDNQCGQIGDDTLISSSTPVKVMENVSTISLGLRTTAAITEDGTLYTWGAEQSIDVDGSVIVGNITVPTAIMENVKYIDLCTNRYAAITEDGTLYTWGVDPILMVNGTLDYIITEPTKVSSDLKFQSVKLSETLSSALAEDGSLYMWGINSKGGIGDGTRVNRSSPVKTLENIQTIDLTNHHVGAITEDGQLYMWGYNAYGQLGDGTTEDSLSPKQIMAGTKFVDLNTVANYTMVVAEDGTEYAWGMDNYSSE